MTCLKSHSEINDRAKNWTFRLWSDDHYDWIYALLDHLAIQIWCRQACVPVELFTAHQIVLVSAGAVRQPRVQWILYAVHSHLSSVVWVMACCTVVGRLVPAYEAVITTGTTLENHRATSKVLFACHHVPGHHGFQDAVGGNMDLLLAVPLKVAFFLLEAGERDVQPWCLGNGVLCWAAQAGKGEQGTELIVLPNLLSLLIKLNIIRPRNCRFLFPEASGSARRAMITSRRLYFKYGEISNMGRTCERRCSQISACSCFSGTCPLNQRCSLNTEEKGTLAIWKVAAVDS